MDAFTTDELRRLDKAHPDGLPAGALLELLRQRGLDLAEATFRKYVQLGLLPRSRRVGRKGKHRGSHGLYPTACLARVVEIRGLMEQGFTLEEIQRSSVVVGQEVEALRRTAAALFERLDAELDRRPGQKTPAAQKRLATLRTQSDALTDALEAATRELLPPVVTPHEPDDPFTVARELSRDPDKSRRPPAKAAKPLSPKSPARPGPVRA